MTRRKVLQYVLDRDPKLAKKLGLTEDSQVLGYGGEGVVFEGPRNTAIKISTTLREATVANRLVGRRLKYVVRVISAHRVGQYSVIKMERLQRAKTVKSPWKERRKCFEAGCDALYRSTGYSHNDIHGKNLMYCSKTKVFKIIDFGSVVKSRLQYDILAGDV